MAATEKSLENYAAKAFKGEGWLAIKLALLAGPGFPDHTVLIPGGRAFFVEYKVPKGRFGPLQLHWLKRLNKYGFSVEVCRSRDDIKNLIKRLKDDTIPAEEIKNAEILEQGEQD